MICITQEVSEHLTAIYSLNYYVVVSHGVLFYVRLTFGFVDEPINRMSYVEFFEIISFYQISGGNRKLNIKHSLSYEHG